MPMKKQHKERHSEENSLAQVSENKDANQQRQDDLSWWLEYVKSTNKEAWETQNPAIFLKRCQRQRQKEECFHLTEEQGKNIKGYRQTYSIRELYESFLFSVAQETKDFSVYLLRYPQGRYVEKCRYLEACEKHDFEGYLKHYPQRKYDELLYFEYAVKTRDLKQYLLRFPQGRYTEQSYYKLAVLTVDAAVYLNNYPHGRYVSRLPEALAYQAKKNEEAKHSRAFKQEKLFYEKCEREGHLDEYFKRYPDKEYAKLQDFMRHQNPPMWLSILCGILVLLSASFPYLMGLLLIYLILFRP